MEKNILVKPEHVIFLCIYFHLRKENSVTALDPEEVEKLYN